MAFDLYCFQEKLVFHYVNILISQLFIKMCCRLKPGPFLVSSETSGKLKKALCAKKKKKKGDIPLKSFLMDEEISRLH